MGSQPRASAAQTAKREITIASRMVTIASLCRPLIKTMADYTATAEVRPALGLCRAETPLSRAR